MSQQTSTAICAGSFDPPTHGHINIIERALKIFDKLVIAIAKNESKKPLFSFEERKDLLENILNHDKRIEIVVFEGLLVDYAEQRGITHLVRGIRTVGDYEYELQMSLANRMLNPKIETVFLMTEGHLSHISSSIIKQVVKLGGTGKDMIHPVVEDAMKKKFKN
ncbi:MAG: pantetheine-phosphate adenylyltransferase [Deltaproteobacteria bacterium]|nr:pantetheine-phosphate adenylyltransferase [Deltaproteobacteria bacterium]